VYDGNGHLVRDSFLEVWQADANGEYQDAYNLENAFNSLAAPPPPSMPVSGRCTRSSRAW
jgi:protocatechuate 3,4-dioxygenase beta subunit